MAAKKKKKRRSAKSEANIKAAYGAVRELNAASKADREAQLADQKMLFLEHFILLGRVDLATKKIGQHYNWPYVQQRDDPQFAKDFEEARVIAAGHIEDAAYSRAVQGILQPVYQRGQLVGMRREFSDSLTIFLLKGLKPKVYRDHVSVETTGKDGGPIETKQQVGLTDELAAQMVEKFLGVSPKEK